jgi:hypothetical protein
MTGTRAGGRKVARTSKQRYGKDIFKITGKRGGNPMLLKKRGGNGAS